MARLIDADKLLQETWGVVIEDMFHMHETVEVVSTIDIEKAPTVPAITIEWIENWKRGKSSIEQVVADKIMMDYKYKDYWEKENETV